MATVLDRLPAPILKHDPGIPSAWTDGTPYQVKRGVDFNEEPQQFIYRLWHLAGRIGCELRAWPIVGTGLVQFQFVPRPA